jgi:hypothetical protein
VTSYRLGDIIDAGLALRFGHPDSLDGEIHEAASYVAQLEELRLQKLGGLDGIYEDPYLDDLEAHVEAQDQFEVISDITTRLDLEMARLEKARGRRSGAAGRMDLLFDWLGRMG